MKTGTIGVVWCLIGLVKKNVALRIGKVCALLFAALHLLSITSWSQEPNPTPDKKQIICSDCFNLNIQPVYLAKPVYPASARYVRASGKVTVSITIDPNGNVVEAKATSGHPFLWASAVKAALASKFVKTYVNGNPIGGVGVISYNFSLNDLDSDQEEFVPPQFSKATTVEDISESRQRKTPFIEVVDCINCNDLVISLPNPKYPALVEKGASDYNGKIGVQILIGEDGKVEKATATFGHPYFRPILEKEALLATFKPNIVEGKARKITGVMIFLIISRAEEAEKGGFEIERKPASTIVSCGVCNQKALFLPKPSYPESARFVGAAGKVTVKILIDEKGRVASAKALSGHPLLRTASEQAALKSLFTPVTLGKIPVKFTGVIVYNFEP